MIPLNGLTHARWNGRMRACGDGYYRMLLKEFFEKTEGGDVI
jgi:hypothetical protein